MKFLSKTVFLVVMSLSLVFFNSCEDNGGGENSKGDLVGTWKIDGVTVDATVGGVPLSTYLMDAMDLPKDQADLMAGIFSGGLGNMAGTITFKSDNTYQANFIGETAETGTWSLSEDGEKLTLVEKDGMEEDTSVLNITSLTSTNLVLSLPPESEIVDFDEDGVDETMDFTMEMRLSK